MNEDDTRKNHARFTPEIAMSILNHLYRGATIQEACDMEKVGVSTFWKHIKEGRDGDERYKDVVHLLPEAMKAADIVRRVKEGDERVLEDLKLVLRRFAKRGVRVGDLIVTVLDLYRPMLEEEAWWVEPPALGHPRQTESDLC